MSSLLEGFAADMRALPWPGNKPSDRPVLRRVDIERARWVRTAQGRFVLHEVNDDDTVTILIGPASPVRVPLGDVLGVTL